METKRKKKLFNGIMAALIAVVILCGVMAVGTVKGWFGDSDSAVVCKDISGVVNIERSGVAYALDKKVAIEADDVIETKNASYADFKINGDNLLAMNEFTEIVFTGCDENAVTMEVTAGEIFADMPDAPAEMTVKFGENTADITGTVFSVSVQSGSYAFHVYEGDVTVTAADGSEWKIAGGEGLDIAEQSDGSYDIETKKLDIAGLNDFMISKLQDCSAKDGLCFTQDELKTVVDEREVEMVEAAEADGDVITTEGNKASSGSKDKGKKEDVMTCTIQIRCETILNNIENLTSGKDRFVPSNGIILATSTVEFTEGETVFDVLKRVCSYAGIQLEYSYTPLYESYYIEGINNLYEFDCGPQSGWMYKVNGWFPNYGCSSYTLKNGDNIVWTYTCNGLGADVGGNVR